MSWEIRINICTTMSEMASGNVQQSELSSVLYDDLHEQDGVGGKSKREEIYVYIQLSCFIVQQKLTQHYKAILFQ